MPEVIAEPGPVPQQVAHGHPLTNSRHKTIQIPADGMRPWEAEDDERVYRLTDSDSAGGRAAFTVLEPRAGRPSRFIFQAFAGDSLLVRLEGVEDGHASTQDFRYARRW